MPLVLAIRGQVVSQLMDDIYQDRSGDVGTQYWNRAAFATPAPGIRQHEFQHRAGLPAVEFDAALSRIFNVTETQRFEVRAEAFNVTNSVRPNDPSNNFNDVNFGRVRSVRDPRVMQFALKYVF